MLNDKQILDLGTCFEQELLSTKREGIKDLLEWLHSTDFFTAPSSTKYHSNYPGGLVYHCLNVLKEFEDLIKKYKIDMPQDSIIICALLHDICKADCYHFTELWTKRNERSVWKKYKGYKFDDSFPIGHGEKSIYLASKFIKLSDLEALCIRWHMGSYNEVRDGDFMNICNKYKEPFLLHIADNIPSTILEDTFDWEDEKYQY